MATIEKVAIYDPRLVQTAPVYGVQKGALSVSTAKFAALAANTNQHTYQILVPSLNVFVDRKVVWDSGVYVTSQVAPCLPCDPNDTIYAAGSPNGTGTAITGWGGSVSPAKAAQCNVQTELYRRTLPAGGLGADAAGNFYPYTGGTSNVVQSMAGDFYEFVAPGVNWNLCPFPLQSLCTNMTASVNDCSVTTNGDTLQEQILLTNSRLTERIRTTPCKFDQYAWTLDDVLATNGNMSTFGTAQPGVGEAATGTWPITFYDPTVGGGGNVLGEAGGVSVKGGAYIDPVNGQPVYFLNGRPVLIPGGILGGTTLSGVSSATPITGTSTSIQMVFTIVSGSGDQASFYPGTVVQIYGFTSTRTPLNGYYVVQAQSSTSTTLTLTLTAGEVLYNSGSATSWVHRATGIGALGNMNSAVTIVSSWAQNVAVNQVSKLLGQVLPDGTQIQPSAMNLPITVCFKYNVQEPVIMSPFLYQDALEFNSVGLYGCTNIQFTMNLQTPANNCQVISQPSWPASTSTPAPFFQARLNCDYPSGGNLIRCTGVTGAFSNVQLLAPLGQSSSGYGPFDTPQMVVQFLTPGPDISLPLISNVPYMELPRYIKQDQLANSAASTYSITTQTITLSSIPDIIMVYVKPRKRSQMQNEVYIPVKNVQVTFDNFSNLCSNMTQQELFQSSVAAGLDMDYQTWRGYTTSIGGKTQGGFSYQQTSPAFGYSQTAAPVQLEQMQITALGGSRVPLVLSTTASDLYPTSSSFNAAGLNKFTSTRATQLVGGPLMLRMGQDVSLSPGLAPGTLGNYSLQITLQLDNQYGFFNQYNTVQTTIIALNSGYFETVRGQSAVRKTILNMADVEAAHADSGITTTALRRLVGAGHHRGHHLSNLGMHGRGDMGMKSDGNVYGAGRKRHHGSSGLM
jgi:hypothetical protein